jgi:hypothetical protein
MHSEGADLRCGFCSGPWTPPDSAQGLVLWRPEHIPRQAQGSADERKLTAPFQRLGESAPEHSPRRSAAVDLEGPHEQPFSR